MRIGLAYNEKPDPDSSLDDPASTSDAFAEWDDPSTIDAVEQALGLFGSVIRLEADPLFPQKLALARPQLLFNMAEGLHGPNRESHVPAICEYLNVPYTASDPLTLSLTLHKARAKEILACRGVPTARFTLVNELRELARVRLRYPLFVKPVAEGSGKGVFAKNLCHTRAELRERVAFLLATYHQSRSSAMARTPTASRSSRWTFERCRPGRRRYTATKRSGSGTRPSTSSTSSSAPRASPRASPGRLSASRSRPTTPSAAAIGAAWTCASTTRASRTWWS